MPIRHIAATITLTVAMTATAGDIEGRVDASEVTVTREAASLRVGFELLLDSLNVPSGRAAVFTPVYVGAADSAVALPAVVVGGRRELTAASRTGRYAGLTQVRRHNGTRQTVPYSASTPWRPWMETGRLILHEDRCGCGLTESAPATQLATADFAPLPEPESVYLRPAAEARKEREAHGSAYLDFPVNRTDILPDYRDNRTELRKIVATIDTVSHDPNVTITAVEIHGYASPEGSYAANSRLAEARAKALSDYVGSLCSVDKKLFTVGFTPENWEGLRLMVAASDLPGRDAILTIIDSDEAPDAREARIRAEHPAAYAVMASDFFPALRRSDYAVRYTVRPFSTDEVMRMVDTAPTQLSLAELFAAAATMPNGSDEFNRLMELAVNLYPDDPTANLNAAVNALNRGDTDRAARYLDKAGDSPQAIHARGILAYRRGNLDEALKLVDQSGVAPDSNVAMIRKAIARRQNQK